MRKEEEYLPSVDGTPICFDGEIFLFLKFKSIVKQWLWRVEAFHDKIEFWFTHLPGSVIMVILRATNLKTGGYRPWTASLIGVNGSFVKFTTSNERGIDVYFSTIIIVSQRGRGGAYLARTCQLLVCVERIIDDLI